MSSNNKPAGFTPGPRHKVFGISDDLLKTTRAILMGEKPEVEEPDEETAEKKEDLSEKSITVSMHSSGTKYKVHSVHKSIAGQIKPGEHLSDTHIDDLKDSGIKINHVKPKPTPKTAKPAVMGYRKEALKVTEHKGDKPHKHPHPPIENEALSHNCANHVKSEQWGDGQCISGMHTLQETSEGEGIVTHYDVIFEHGIEQNVPVEDLEIVSEKHHTHKKSMKEDDDNGNGNDDENGDDNGNGKSKKKSKKSKKLDKVDPDELEGSHDERDDQDIDNDDDVDASDKYLHKRRKAVHKAIKKEEKEQAPGRDPSGKRFNPAAARTRPKPIKRPSEKKVLDILALNRKHY